MFRDERVRNFNTFTTVFLNTFRGMAWNIIRRWVSWEVLNSHNVKNFESFYFILSILALFEISPQMIEVQRVDASGF